MTANPRSGTTTVMPFTRYKDASAAIEWLCAAFGFQKQLIVPASGSAIAHAELSFGPAFFALATERDDVLRLCSPRDVGCVTQGVYFYVEDVDAHFERAKAAGAEIVRAIENTDYDSREYTARDPEGHLWSFGTYLPGSGA
jgi:uncharacterized glyoxalase superfamily protein PhnB